MTDEEAFHTLPVWTVAAPAGARGGPCAGRSGGCHRNGLASGGVLWWRRGQGSGKGPKKFKNQKKGMSAQVEGSSSGGDRPGGPGC